MKNEIFFILLIIPVLLWSCNGLICKSGYSFIRNDYGFKDQIGNRTCPDTVDYCAAITCTKAGRNGLSAIFWACASMDMKESKEKWFEDYYVKNLSVPNVHCHAEFGEKHKDFGNTHFKRPRVPDGLLCYAGEEFIKLDFCEDDDHFCYLAKCTKDTKQWKTKLGCSPYDSCGFIADAEEKNATGSTVNCNCKFGGKDVTKSNGEFTLEDVDFPTAMLTTKRKRKTKSTSTTTTTTMSTMTENPSMTQDPTMTMETTNEAEMNSTDENNAIGHCANFGGLMLMIAAFAVANSLIVDQLLQFNAY
ncbi:hypothetical protein niasHS_008823 [Heterodera schachtii]|uniref:Uncharacterized protein n=1 Tax=Heterodera schachtii TaxID=97005 RepID=A0ABD2J2J3_HETSC